MSTRKSLSVDRKSFYEEGVKLWTFEAGAGKSIIIGAVTVKACVCGVCM